MTGNLSSISKNIRITETFWSLVWIKYLKEFYFLTASCVDNLSLMRVNKGLWPFVYLR